MACMAFFMTLCEAYMVIDLHFDLWNYFFRTWLQQGLNAEAAVWGQCGHFIRSGPGVDPCFRFLMFDSPIRWKKVWFFLTNDVDAPFPMFTSKRPILQPNGGTVWLNSRSTSFIPCVMSSSSY
jgi:hypothetical protein